MGEAIQVQTKFDTCKHRSPEPVTKIIKRCSCRGGNYEQKSFSCLKRNIFNINHTFCESCQEYESK
jgi:hypothetical protein